MVTVLEMREDGMGDIREEESATKRWFRGGERKGLSLSISAHITGSSGELLTQQGEGQQKVL